MPTKISTWFHRANPWTTNIGNSKKITSAFEIWSAKAVWRVWGKYPCHKVFNLHSETGTIRRGDLKIFQQQGKTNSRKYFSVTLFFLRVSTATSTMNAVEYSQIGIINSGMSSKGSVVWGWIADGVKINISHVAFGGLSCEKFCCPFIYFFSLRHRRSLIVVGVVGAIFSSRKFHSPLIIKNEFYAKFACGLIALKSNFGVELGSLTEFDAHMSYGPH